MSKLPEIAHLRGLGNPHYFTFNIEEKTHIMVSHGVIFCSLVQPAKATLNLLRQGDDPRFDHFMQYVSQFFDEKTKEARDRLRQLKKDVAEIEEQLSKLKQQLKEM